MGERKVLNKYIPHDFDPKLVPRGKKPKDGLIPVRMMLPFSIQCSTCHTFMYRGRKFNSKKEAMGGPDGKYLNTIQRWRFYIKCSSCSRPVTFLTDPKNADYEMETGGTRTYEVHKDRKSQEEDQEASELDSQKKDPMKALENRALASQKEMADLDNLDQIKAMNMKHLKIMASAQGPSISDTLLSVLRKKQSITEQEHLNENGLTTEEEDMVKSIKFGASSKTHDNIRRLGENEEKQAEFSRKRKEQVFLEQQNKISKKAKSLIRVTKKQPIQPLFKLKKKIASTQPKNHFPDKSFMSKQNNQNNNSNNGLTNLLGAYGTSSDDSD